MRIALTVALLASGGAAAGPAAEPAAAQQGALLAAVCAGCHRAEAGEDGGIPALEGLSADEIADKLLAYRNGEVQGTLMNRLARGYTTDQIRLLAEALGGATE